MRRAALLLCFVAAATSSARADCVADAARYHGISVVLMQAIVMQESSGKPDSLNCGNSNKTCDYGLTQTNSMHLGRLQQFGAKPNDLFDPCVSAYVGAWILSENFARLGVTWEAVGAYNAASPAKRAAYAKKISAKVDAIRTGRIRPPVFFSGAKSKPATSSLQANSPSTVEKP